MKVAMAGGHLAGWCGVTSMSKMQSADLVRVQYMCFQAEQTALLTHSSPGTAMTDPFSMFDLPTSGVRNRKITCLWAAHYGC